MFEYYEPYFTLDLPAPLIDTKASEVKWVQYNPRKPIARWGASITSLDGGTAGIPDLDSLKEYNKENSTDYCEKDFKMKTPIYKYFDFLENHFDFGRSHLIRLGAGGYFPYHRDFDTETFRLIYTIGGCEDLNLVWIQHDSVIKLENKKWYYINTKMIHSLFSFFGSEFVVFNMLANQKGRTSLVELMSVK